MNAGDGVGDGCYVEHVPLAREPGVMPDTWRGRIEGLARACEGAAWASSLKTVYQNMVDVLAEVLDCDLVNIYLLTVTGNYFTEYASHGNSCRSAGCKDGQLPTTVGRLQGMITSHTPIIMDYLHPHPDDIIPPSAVELGFKSAISVPLVAGDDMLGAFNLCYKQALAWSDDDIGYLLAIGRVLGTSVQRAQMSKKYVELQVLDERKRLSTEIHDNLAQLVTSLKLGAETTLLSHEEGDDAAVRRGLVRLEAIGQEALKYLREEMLSLRITTEQGEGLVTDISECLRRFEEQWGIRTALEVVGTQEPVPVTVQTELHLTRILHESLSNTLRHAKATQVNVTLEAREMRLYMRVHDDGCGFDPTVVKAGHLGIRIMQERVESMGGKLGIESGAGAGTTVCVELPRRLWLLK